MSSWDEQVYEDGASGPMTLDSKPSSWVGVTKENKVQIIVNVIDEQMRLVRNGTFNVMTGKEVAALALEGQLVLAEFYADAEAKAKEAKHISEYIEAEVAAKINAENVAASLKPLSEAALKRKSLLSDEVKEAKRRAIDLEKDHKKWRCILEILKEAHVFFRNIAKE